MEEQGKNAALVFVGHCRGVDVRRLEHGVVIAVAMLESSAGFAFDARGGFAVAVLGRPPLPQEIPVQVVAAISPYRTIRDEVRQRIGDFIEVHVNAPLAVCESRDPKGLYKKARAGEIRRFTGIDDPYEPPLAPELRCDTDRESLQECARNVVAAVTACLGAEDAC